MVIEALRDIKHSAVFPVNTRVENKEINYNNKKKERKMQQLARASQGLENEKQIFFVATFKFPFPESVGESQSASMGVKGGGGYYTRKGRGGDKNHRGMRG